MKSSVLLDFLVQNDQGAPASIPLWSQLPKSPARFRFTGLSRSHIYSLIQPTLENGYNPPVKSVSLKAKHATRGVRLYHVPSLLDWIESQAKHKSADQPGQVTASHS